MMPGYTQVMHNIYKFEFIKIKVIEEMSIRGSSKINDG